MYDQITHNKRKTYGLMVLTSAIILALGYIIGEYTGFGQGAIIIAFGVSVLLSLTGYYTGDRVALLTAGAIGPLEKNDNPYVYRMVENLCITAGLPMPNIYIIPQNTLNAFATGRDPNHASIALTQGIITHLENEELEGVIAHELAHIKNYDIRVMTIVIVLVGVIALLADWLLRANLFHGSKDNNRNGTVLFLIGVILAILAPLFAQLIQLAVSRKREFMADASGALLTRYPQGLANALKKIAVHSHIASANRATAHLYIASPFAGKKMSKLFATHPPIEERIAALQAMA